MQFPKYHETPDISKTVYQCVNESLLFCCNDHGTEDLVGNCLEKCTCLPVAAHSSWFGNEQQS